MRLIDLQVRTGARRTAYRCVDKLGLDVDAEGLLCEVRIG